MKKLRKVFALILTIGMLVFFIPVEVQSASDSAIKLNKEKVTLYPGATKTLKLKGTKKTPKWTSSKKSVATVSSKGKIKAKKKGITVIKAKLDKKIYRCKVTVKETPSATPNPIPTDMPNQTPDDDFIPTPTSEPSVEDNYQKLADYIMENGTFDSYDNYYEIVYHEAEVTLNLYPSIKYYLNGKFEFSNMLIVPEEKSDIFTLTITPSEYDRGIAENILMILEDYSYLYASGEVRVSSLTTGENHTVYTFKNVQSQSDIKAVCDSGDSMLNDGLCFWNTMVEEADLELSLKNLGFTSYE